MTIRSLLRIGVCLLCVAGIAAAQSSAPASESSETILTTPPPAIQSVSPWELDPAGVVDFGPLTPSLNAATLAWIAAILILTLKLQTRPLRSIHNLDALVLALTCLLLPLRSVTEGVDSHASHGSYQFWSYALLTASGGYWLLRGLMLLLRTEVSAIQANVSEGSLTVLVIAALTVACYSVVTAPISEGSRDGLAGGICLAETGKLPYGDMPGQDNRSPLLYAVHALAAKAMPVTYTLNSGPLAMTWGSRQEWIQKPWWNHVDSSPIRAVNAMLFLLTFVAIAGIGHRHHSLALGQSIAAVFCLFPGTLECLAQPEIMLPTMLLTWSLASLRVPAVGGILSAIFAVLAGVAWPWAWLVVPVLMGYWLRTGWNGLGAMMGLVVGFGAVGYGVAAFTAPSLPRADGALAGAGLPPKYLVAESEGRLDIQKATGTTEVRADLRAPLWRFLLQGDVAKLYPTDGLNFGAPLSEPIMYRELAVSAAALPEVQTAYRKSIGGLAPETRFWPALRTVLEATWKPMFPPAAPQRSVWSVWFGDATESSGASLWVRRSGKLLAVLIALGAFIVLIRQSAARPHQAVGGVLAVCAAALLFSDSGAAAYWVWLAPAALGAMAATSERVESGRDSAERITVNG